jgi:urea transport system substrate-binding protein
MGEQPVNAGPPPSKNSEAVDPRIGQTFGKYRITKLLGRGGMGAVYLGEDAALKRSVAVKFLPDDVLSKPDVVERFMREAQVAGRLNHPNIIAIYDVGHDERGCYMVMELLHPNSASSRVRQKGPYHWLIATRIIADSCAALKIAHEAGIVHRDIKPDNILFSQSGVVKVVDFGLVKLMEDEAHLTQTGMLCGTPLYMSPEQASNAKMDSRSDLYSLGATYYALLTGVPPFLGNGVPQILLSHVKDPTPDPREKIPDIPEACVQVLNRAMEKKPGARYQSAGDMGADMELILAGLPQRNMSIFSMEEMEPASLSLLGQGSAQFAGQSIASGNLRSQLAAAASQPAASLPPATGLSRRQVLTYGAAGAIGALGLGSAAFFGIKRAGSSDPLKRNPNDPTGGPTPAREQAPLKVGILHSLSGSLAISEHPLADASILAVEEINARGGVLGRRITPVTLDGKSEVTADSAFTHAAERLIEKEKVAAVFGGYGSAGRKVIRPYFEKSDHLLFYPAQYEGLEESQSVIYTGATPNQLAIPAIKWCLSELKAKRFYLIGTDGLRARAINAIIEDSLKGTAGDVVGEHYALVGEYQLDPIIKKIKRAKPHIIINMLVGDSNVSFFKAMAEADIEPSALPVLSFTLGENELAQVGNLSLAGHYIARTRFPELPNASKDDRFAKRFKKKYGEHRPVSEVMEAAYYGVYLWAAAVEKAGTEEVNRVRIALKEKEYELVGVRLRVDPSNQHTWKVFEIGRIGPDNHIESIKSGEAPIPPIPFPGPRTRAEWEAFSQQLYVKWGENWANPLKPHAKKMK